MRSTTKSSILINIRRWGYFSSFDGEVGSLRLFKYSGTTQSRRFSFVQIQCSSQLVALQSSDNDEEKRGGENIPNMSRESGLSSLSLLSLRCRDRIIEILSEKRNTTVFCKKLKTRENSPKAHPSRAITDMISQMCCFVYESLLRQKDIESNTQNNFDSFDLSLIGLDRSTVAGVLNWSSSIRRKIP